MFFTGKRHVLLYLTDSNDKIHVGMVIATSYATLVIDGFD